MSLRFLVSNDDGYDAPGIEALVAVLRKFGTTTVVAPLAEQSGCGHRVTTHQPLTLKQIGDDWYSLDCTPADCVRVAISHLKLEVDFVVAGINAGGNLGCDVFMSGTVAAAREAALLGVPSIAVSQYRRTREPVDWERAQRWITPAIQKCLEEPRQLGVYWNLNLPDPAITPDAGNGTAYVPPIIRCPLDTNPLAFRYERQDDHLVYRGTYQERGRTPEYDVAVCFDGSISMTRLQLSLHA
ncbi:MAG: 5'/3'-nucleotidase SurE [Planctomycetia bacterium]|nr:5'/3'-nucleotidase SurE [Planctomycetia bacterium]